MMYMTGEPKKKKKEENPNHLEDFEALITQASELEEEDGQTLDEELSDD